MASSPRDAISAGLAALQARDPARAAALLREAATAEPPGMPWLALGNAELALGNLDAAEAAIDRQLALAFRDIGSLLMKAHLRERQGDARGASSFYQVALNQAQVEPCPAPLQGLLDHAARFVADAANDFAGHLREVVGSDISPRMKTALDMLSGETQVHLQQPNLFYYPFLPQKWFYEPGDFPWLEGMLALLPAMQAEWAAGIEDGFEPYVQARGDRPAPNNPLLGSMAWSACYFWRDGAIVEANAARAPMTMQALALAPMPRIAGRSPSALWSRLQPGAHIAPHHGMLNTRLICHIPIRPAPGCTLRVGGETRGWDAGVPLVFDDSIEHEARNAGPEERVVLLFEIWRPEVPEEDREALGRVFQAIQSYGVN